MYMPVTHAYMYVATAFIKVLDSSTFRFAYVFYIVGTEFADWSLTLCTIHSSYGM